MKLLIYIHLLCFCITVNAQHISTEELLGKGQPQLFNAKYKLRKDAYDAFLKMKDAAKQDGIHIGIVSSYRNFEHQKRIWTRKYKRFTSQGLPPEQAINRIIEYSTIPGTSRHHWGTDIDVIDTYVKQPKNVLNPTNFHSNGPYSKLKQWMDVNANNFGFYLVYTNNNNRKGFKYEPWHYSYKPLSKPYLQQYKTLDIITILKHEQLIGSEYFTEAFFKRYYNENILDINPELL